MMNLNRSKKKAKITEEEKREKIRVAMMKKKDLEKKTLVIVEQLLETGLSESFLIEVSSSLNQNYYSDAVEERSLAGSQRPPSVYSSLIFLQVSAGIPCATSRGRSPDTKEDTTYH